MFVFFVAPPAQLGLGGGGGGAPQSGCQGHRRPLQLTSAEEGMLEEPPLCVSAGD